MNIESTIEAFSQLTGSPTEIVEAVLRKFARHSMDRFLRECGWEVMGLRLLEVRDIGSGKYLCWNEKETFAVTEGWTTKTFHSV